MWKVRACGIGDSGMLEIIFHHENKWKFYFLFYCKLFRFPIIKFSLKICIFMWTLLSRRIPIKTDNNLNVDGKCNARSMQSVKWMKIFQNNFRVCLQCSCWDLQSFSLVTRWEILSQNPITRHTKYSKLIHLNPVHEKIS